MMPARKKNNGCDKTIVSPALRDFIKLNWFICDNLWTVFENRSI